MLYFLWYYTKEIRHSLTPYPFSVNVCAKAVYVYRVRKASVIPEEGISDRRGEKLITEVCYFHLLMKIGTVEVVSGIASKMKCEDPGSVWATISL